MDESPHAPTTMTFGEALNELIAGNQVQRVDWEDIGVYLTMENDRVMIFNEDKKPHTLIVTKRDIVADDWIILMREIH